MSQHQGTPGDDSPVIRPLDRSALTLWDACRQAYRPALSRTGWAFVVVAIFFAFLSFASDQPISIFGILVRSAAVAAFVGLGIFARRILALSRHLVDTVFKTASLMATLLGFLMLVALFWRLAVDARAWFRTMPILIQQRAVERQSEDPVSQGLREIERQMSAELKAAATDEERREIRDLYEKRIMPRKRADLEATARELQRDKSNRRDDVRALSLVRHFLTTGPSNEPQEAGILPALLGSIFVGLLAVLIAVPLGVGAAIYLEEYRHRSWLGTIIQLNVRNLAGIPSVVYGILGAFVFVELVFKPLEGEMNTPALLQMIVGKESADRYFAAIFGQNIASRNVLGGGLTLALLTLPVVIVSSQEAIRAVPESLRHAALALGATRWQVIWHHVLPQARPGILTGIILCLSRVLGEAAPLVLFGALLYVNHYPALFSRFTVLPMQIFGWVDRPNEAWRYQAAMASIVLLVTLFVLNATAIFMRYRGQRSR